MKLLAPIISVNNFFDQLWFLIKKKAYHFKLIKKDGIDYLDGLFLLLIAILCFLTFIYRLNAYPLRLWDEARNAVNAIEMLKNNNYLVLFFNGIPDLWNTKPPLFIWTVVALFKTIGVNELSVRLPSALSASCVVILMYLFARLILKDRIVGLMSTLIIISSMGFADTHIGRTGDFDAMLTLWVFLGAIAFFTYITNHQRRYLIVTAVSLTLAVFTKGVAGLFMLPGMLIYILITKNLTKLLKKPSFWIAIIASLSLIALYYIGRELALPGYLSAVWKEEFASRYGSLLRFNQKDFLYYWKPLSEFRFQVWIYYVPVSILAVFLTKNKTHKQWVLFNYLLIGSCFFIISNADAKNLWYDAQLYPFMSLAVASIIILFIKKVPILIRLLPILILCFYTQRYVRTNLAFIHRHDVERTYYSCIHYGYLFRDPPKDLTSYTLIDHDALYCMPFFFYTSRANVKRNITSIVTNGEKYLTCNENTVKKIEETNKISRLYKNSDGCVGFQIESVK